MPSIVQKLDELIVAAGGQPTGSGLPIDKKVEQARDALSFLTNQPSIYISSIPKEDGMLVDTKIHFKNDGCFCALLTQYDYTVDGKQWMEFIFTVPKKYAGKHDCRVLAIKPSDSLVEVTEDNATINQSINLNYNDYWLHYYTLSNTLNVAVNKYALFRVMMRLYDEDKIVRKIYTPQMICFNNNGTYEYSVDYYPNYEDCIVDGFLTKEDELDSIYFNTDKTWQRLKSDSFGTFEDSLHRVNGEYIYENGRSRLIPYSELSEDMIIFPVLVYGDGKYIIGNFIKPQLPSQSNG